MLVYLSAAYSQHPHKNILMQDIMRFAGEWMLMNPEHRVVSPLFLHYSLDWVPALGSDYAFWGDYSRELLSNCKLMVVFRAPGTDIEKSIGVQDEIRLAKELDIPIIFTSIPQHV